MLRSNTLMLDNTLIPLYQERVTSRTLNTDDEHTNEQFNDDEEDEEEQSLLMTGTGRRAGKHESFMKKLKQNRFHTEGNLDDSTITLECFFVKNDSLVFVLDIDRPT